LHRDIKDFWEYVVLLEVESRLSFRRYWVSFELQRDRSVLMANWLTFLSKLGSSTIRWGRIYCLECHGTNESTTEV